MINPVRDELHRIVQKTGTRWHDSSFFCCAQKQNNRTRDRIIRVSASPATTSRSLRRSPALAREWKAMGEQNFVIEVLDELKPIDDPAYDYQEDLKALETMWLEKLKPFGEQGYH